MEPQIEGGISALPSMAGARSRQLMLTKIVPYDFVEPSPSGSNSSLSAINKKAPHCGAFLFMAEREGFEPS